MIILIFRGIIWWWLTSFLLGCSVPHPFPNDGLGHGQPRGQSPRAADKPAIVSETIVSETPSLPDEREGKEKSPHNDGSRLAETPRDTVEKEETLKKDDNIPEKEDTIRQESARAATDDELVDLWRDDMDKAMARPSGDRNIRLSRAVQTNRRVRYYVENFCGRLRDFFERALARSGKYRSLMGNILRKEGLPENLVYLALIESGFSPDAYSRANAIGPWQFIHSTALRYGLTINSWVDERKDPVLSTRAAAAYLKDLYEKFGEWFLAAAAYNAGEATVGNAVQHSRTNDYWILSQKRKQLKLETRDYVPKFVAATLIAGAPEKYGFEDVAYEPPLEYDQVTIRAPLRLQTVAKLANTEVNVIKELNPALLRNFTPPKDDGFALRLPVGSGKIFLAAYKLLPSSAKIKLSLHRVKKGDVLSRIAKQNGLTVNQLMKENGLKSWRLRPGQELVIVRSEAGKVK
jgi:membrane-bound lytic murein transglycosylase D